MYTITSIYELALNETSKLILQRLLHIYAVKKIIVYDDQYI